ncbi:hypothetical protein [Rhodococcus sp. 5G237]
MSIEIATKVLMKARFLDKRIENSDGAILAWAECFQNENVWPLEASQAVAEHYKKENPFPIMPGDVIAYCKKQPVWSSNQHAWDFLQKWAEYPYATVIQEYTGIPWPEIDPPEGMTLQEERAWLKETRRKWVYENKGVLVGAILSQRHRPREIEG